jgi:phage shock protein A
VKITENEMRGLLAGKCLPSDILVGENLAAYLVRKFAALQQKLDTAEAKLEAAKSVKESWKNRAWTAEEKLTEQQQKLDALAAENDALKEFPKQILKFLRTLGSSEIGSQTFGKIETAVCRMKTPFTDDIINQQRAEGIIMFASKQLAAAGDLESTITLERLMLDAEQFAGQLRSGQEESK